MNRAEYTKKHIKVKFSPSQILTYSLMTGCDLTTRKKDLEPAAATIVALIFTADAFILNV